MVERFERYRSVDLGCDVVARFERFEVGVLWAECAQLGSCGASGVSQDGAIAMQCMSASTREI